MWKFIVIVASGWACWAVSTDASAQESAEAESPWRLGIAFGYGERSNPLLNADDLRILVDLDIAWFGERFFFDNGDGGLSLVEKPAYTLNLIGRFNSDRVFFSKIDAQLISIGLDGSFSLDTSSLASTGAGWTVISVEPPDRDYAIEAGIEVLADGDWGFLQAGALRDVSETHDGYELFASYSRRLIRKRWVMEPSLGFYWKSQRMNDYFWGVRNDEATPLFAAYRAEAGLNWRARFSANYQFSRRVSVFAVAEFERLNTQAAASSIVSQDRVVGGYAGFKYRF